MGKVTPTLEVLDVPSDPACSAESPTVFPACVVTRAQACQMTCGAGSDISQADTVFCKPLQIADSTPAKEPASMESAVEPSSSSPPLPATRERLAVAQREDPTLQACSRNVVSDSNAASGEKVVYYLENGVLMRRWSPGVALDADWQRMYQIVVPSVYRQHVLSVAHESKWSAHLGVTKTYQSVLRHFFWPGLKTDTATFCRSCHVCQVTGKPNRKLTAVHCRLNLVQETLK